MFYSIHCKTKTSCKTKVKLFHLIYDTAIYNAEDFSQF